MTKICPECKTENMDSAEFCQNCGAELPKFTYNVPQKDVEATEKAKSGGWWSRQSTGVKLGIAIGGICCIGIIVIIVLFGMYLPDLSTTSNTTTNTATSTAALGATFSQGGLTFNYPSDWVTSTVTYNGTSLSVQNLGTYASPQGLTLDVNKQDMTATVAQAKDGTINNIKTAMPSAQILSETKKTINGLTVYELVLTYTNSNTNNQEKSLYVITGKDGQVAYYMQFMDELDKFDQNRPLMDSIVNTIKIS
jgi:hypothetical protein